MQAAPGATLNEAEPGGTAAPGPQVSPRRIGLLLSVAIFVLTVDIVSKVIVVAKLSNRDEPVSLLGGLIKLELTRNSGAAFNIGQGATIVFTAIAVAVVIAIIHYATRLRSTPWAITLGLLLGGASGNLVDRIFRAPQGLQGHVVDWIAFPHWPVFNLADSAISCGGVVAVLLAARGIRLDGTRADGDDGDPGGDSSGASTQAAVPADQALSAGDGEQEPKSTT